MKVELEISEEMMEAIARRAAELVLERMPAPMPVVDVSPWLTVDEAATFLGCSTGRIYNLRSDGRLSAHKDGGRALIARSELEGLVEGPRDLSPAERVRRVA